MCSMLKLGRSNFSTNISTARFEVLPVSQCRWFRDDTATSLGHSYLRPIFQIFVYYLTWFTAGIYMYIHTYSQIVTFTRACRCRRRKQLQKQIFHLPIHCYFYIKPSRLINMPSRHIISQFSDLTHTILCTPEQLQD